MNPGYSRPSWGGRCARSIAVSSGSGNCVDWHFGREHSVHVKHAQKRRNLNLTDNLNPRRGLNDGINSDPVVAEKPR
jgi:hypothetical protein